MFRPVTPEAPNSENRKPPTKAPTTPMTLSIIKPSPVLLTILLAIKPEIRPRTIQARIDMFYSHSGPRGPGINWVTNDNRRRRFLRSSQPRHAGKGQDRHAGQGHRPGDPGGWAAADGLGERPCGQGADRQRDPHAHLEGRVDPPQHRGRRGRLAQADRVNHVARQEGVAAPLLADQAANATAS